MAAEEINAAGGIKSLGGAKIKLIIADASFEASGKRINPPGLLLQWQNGVPVVVYPSDLAIAAPLKATQ